MDVIDSATPVGQLAAQFPLFRLAFERLGIDYCCGGRQTLDEVCRERGLDLAGFHRELIRPCENASKSYPHSDWNATSLTSLIKHIVDTHHSYLRRVLPSLCNLSHKVAARHGPAHPSLQQVNEVLHALADEIEQHLKAEEQVLFPWIEELERSPETAGQADLEEPLSTMLADHQEVAAALHRLRTLTSDYRSPPEACSSYCGLLSGLAELEQDLKEHIHLENNVLFARAAALANAESSC